MNYLKAERLSKSYGEKVLFNNIDISINEGQKVALIAKNGTGKTSLLNTLAGKAEPDSGQLFVHRSVRLGYLPQMPEFDQAATVLEAVYDSENEVLQLLRDYDLLISKTVHTASEEQEIQRLINKIDEKSAWDYEAKIKEILSKLSINELSQSINTLSGGQRKRVALASVLVREPDFLILDEPTNHLDMDMIEWLEQYLSRSKMTLLVVTHDRYFLDAVCNEILELHQGNIRKYRGDYAYYLEKKTELDGNKRAQIDNAKRLMRGELEWMRRQPKARGTKAKARIESFYTLEETASQQVDTDQVQFRFKMSRVGKKTAEMHYVSKAFPGIPICAEFNYLFKRRDRIGVVGRNGTGKTTFLNMLMGLEKPDSGTVVVGETIVFGYYRQEGIQLEEDKRMIDVVRDVAEFVHLEGGLKLTAPKLLELFLFPRDMHRVYVSQLSGGERRRLHLLTVLMKAPNFLVLDEPTNDIDLETLNVLEEFLALFNGCLLVVTHDRYFMDKLVDHLFVFEGEGVIRDFPGNYTDYRNFLEIHKEEEPIKKESKPTPKKKYQKTRDKKLSYNEQKEFKRLETEIELLEGEKSDLEAKLSVEIKDHGELIMLSEKLSAVLTELEKKTERWFELGELA